MLGVGITAVAALAVHRIGVLLLMLGGIAGQMIGALVIDLVTGYTPGASTVVATLLAFAAVLVPVAASRRS